ncbi:TfoX N-terminal domain-containing protein [Chitinophaga rupis]|uniref:TfoX N-terminal domain-containing protein n=1 Tax=Chitinophaga rupis TaxID=573321 RepID=A0A1H7RE59_9BACT|nr:TfoX/Sxy family protein [Chitinophaga rupis]SEL58442.1 TfoX N-terminal domain-containing protein [Chitinophaga rupis]
MPYNEQLAIRIRKALAGQPALEEKKMMGGLTFMVDGKMCVGIMKDELMCRIDPMEYAEALQRKGCHEMAFTGRPLKGFVLIAAEGMQAAADFNYWIRRALAYNKVVPAAKRKK